ncbi:hypothetical protein KFU94_53950 [Chloroflexi bacterium TSY]|nr:hypothetical protein [Chloroflexi bacterium TSY]
MNGLRFWILILLAWLVALIAIEHPLVPADMRLNAYIFVAVSVILTLMIPRVKNPYYAFVLGLLILAFILTEVYQVRDLDQVTSFYLTLTYASAILLTGLITRRLGQRIFDLESFIADTTFAHIGPYPKLYEESRGVMYEEVQRARRYERPLSAVMLKFDEQTIKTALPKVVRDIQRSLTKEFLLAKMAHTLDDNLHSFNPIALQNDCFVAFLPETTEQEAEQIALRLQDAIEQSLNIRLQSGVASLSHECVTFETLMDNAKQQLKHGRAPLKKHQLIQPNSRLSKQEIVS